MSDIADPPVSDIKFMRKSSSLSNLAVLMSFNITPRIGGRHIRYTWRERWSPRHAMAVYETLQELVVVQLGPVLCGRAL